MVGLNGAAQQATRADDVLLANVLVKRARAHARGQRRILLQPFFVGLLKEIHAPILPQNHPCAALYMNTHSP